jgi:ketosteroid isomerase-like protein
VLTDGGELCATGQRVEVKGMELVRVRDGKIVVDNLYCDTFPSRPSSVFRRKAFLQRIEGS